MKLTNTDARERLRLVGLNSATVLTGSSTITIDTATFDLLCRIAGCARTRDLNAAGIKLSLVPPT